MCAEVKPTVSPAPPAEDVTPASKVLGNDDLVGEILNHVDSSTTLVRAAAVSKRWLRRASDRAFLRRFRARHPPCLLGFYVTGDCVLHPEFVPMPGNTDISAAALRRAGCVFDAFPPCSSRVWDSRNGCVLFDFTEDMWDPRRFAVRDTLRDPGGARAELPPQPPPTLPEWCHAMLLPDDDDGDNATCYRVDVHHVGRSVSAEVLVLRSGAWTVRCSSRAELAAAPERIPMITLLAGGKVYMVTVAGYLIGVDLATANLFTIELPDGVAYAYYGNLVPSRARGDDSSALYLFHVRGDKLSVWLLRRTDDDHPGEWVLWDTVSLKETCSDLIKESQGSEQADGDTITSVSVVGAGDNAEFAFLELYVGDTSIVVYLHLGSRRAEKVYQRDPENDEIIEVHPFVMVWPPVFPALAASDEGEELRHG